MAPVRKAPRRVGEQRLWAVVAVIIICLALTALAGYLAYTAEMFHSYNRLFLAVGAVGGAVGLFTYMILTWIDPPDGDLFSPEYQRLAYEKWLEEHESRKRDERIRRIMREQVGNPED